MPFPRSWKYWKQIYKDDDDVTKAEKYKYNSMVVKKKPYFFTHLYSTLMQDYKNYEKNFNTISYTHFGVSMKVLLRKEQHTESELSLIRKYRKYSPVLETDCIMNNLCKEIENADFDIKYHPNVKSLIEEFTREENCDVEKVDRLEQLLKEYKSKKKYRGIEALIDNEGIQDEDMNEILHTVLYANKDNCREAMLELFSSNQELFDYLVFTCKKNKWSMDYVWEIMGDDIIDIIPYGDSKVPVDCADGFEYLGHHYRLKGVIKC